MKPSLEDLTAYVEHLTEALTTACLTAGCRPPASLERFIQERDSKNFRSDPATRIHLGEMDGIPMYADRNCPLDRMVFERNGSEIVGLVLHPKASVLSEEAKLRIADAEAALAKAGTT